MSRLTMLHTGALRQLGGRVARLEDPERFKGQVRDALLDPDFRGWLRHALAA
jgi:hypothetical protein